MISHRRIHGYVGPQVFEYESGDGDELIELLSSGLRPDIVCWYISRPVHPIPRARFGYVLEKVFNRTQREVTFAVGTPVSSTVVIPAGPPRFISTAEGLIAIGNATLGVHSVPVDIREEEDPALRRARFRRGR